jgi:hypothetical protein
MPPASDSGWITTAQVTLSFAPPRSVWQVKGYSLLLSPNPYYEADKEVDTPTATWTFENLSDGTYYFSAHALLDSNRWLKGEALRLKVDIMSPDPPQALRCYDSLFERQGIASNQTQALTRRPLFTWHAPRADKGSRIATYRISWMQEDGTLIEQKQSDRRSFFPQSPVPAAGVYRLSIFSQDDAGWQSPEPAEFIFVYSPE